MNYKIDLHTHTIASGHAYSTIIENYDYANKNGLELIATTDHGPGLPGGPHDYYFTKFKSVPKYINGVRALMGIEANIIDINGNLDLGDEKLKFLDLILTGFHDESGYPPCDNEIQNTDILLKVIKAKKADVIAHVGNPKYPIDYLKVLKCAKDLNVAIELNNSSFAGSRRGSKKNCMKVIKIANDLGSTITLGSDAHFVTEICDFEIVISELKKMHFPEKLILNRSKKKVYNFLNSNNNKIRVLRVKE